jgi:pilus assembly protein CpaB
MPMNETSPSSGAPSGAPSPRRTVRRPGSLPSGRAVLGGLLVAAAGVGVFAAYAGAQETPTHQVVVADTDLPAGHRLTADDLRLEAADLPTGTLASTHATVESLVGSVTLAPLGADEVVQGSAVRSPDVTHEPVHEFSFPVDRDRAVDGDLRPGERVDLLATYGTGNDAYTAVLARGAVVTAIDSSSRSTLTSGGALVLTVALGSADQVLDIAHASQVASLTVVRATLADSDGSGRDRTQSPGTGSTGRVAPSAASSGSSS